MAAGAPGGIKIESRAAATPGKWQRVGVARQDGWLFLLVDGVVVGRSKCAASPAIGSVCLGGYGIWRDPNGDTPMWSMGGEMASARIVPLTAEQGVGQLSTATTYSRSLPELSTSPVPAVDWATLALTPLKLNTILSDSSTKENMICKDGSVVLASGGFGECLDAANGGWLKYQPDYFSDSEQEVTVEAWLFLEDPTRTGTIVDHPGMYRLESRPAAQGGELVWSLRVGGYWRSVELPLPTKSWISVCASFDGQTIRLSSVENGKTVKSKQVGLMSRNGSALWLGAAEGGKNGFPGAIARARVSRAVRGTDKFMAATPFPAAIKMRPVEPVSYTDSVDVMRPDGIVDHMRKVLPSTSMSIPLATHVPVVDGEDNDECWRSVPVESTLPITVGYEPHQRHPNQYKVETQLTRDADRIYGFMRLIAPRSGLFTIGNDNKDDWRALKDCVELFLVPGDSPSIPYYQICFGLGGGIYDGKERDKNWNAANLKHAVKVSDDSASIEFSIPFSDFGQTPPTQGTRWRGNVFASLGGNQASWSFIWPLPHTQFHFGTMEFTGTLEKEQVYVPCAVRGRLVDEKGAPVAWNFLHAAGGVGVDGHLTRTDNEGYFEINGLEAKLSTLQSFIPLCDAVSFQVELKPGMNDLGPIVMSPRRTHLPKWRAPVKKSSTEAAVVWFKTWISSAPDMGKAPLPAQWAKPEPEAVIAPGETEDVAAAFVALKSLENTTAFVDGLKTVDGKVISADKIRVRWVSRQLMVHGYGRPPENSSYVWKHLRDEAPSKLFKDDVAMLAITISAPEDAQPGEYRGEIQLRAAGAIASALPIRVTVAPFKLAKATKQVGMYNYTILNGGKPAPIKSKEQQRAEMEDLRDHNCSLVVMCASHIDDRPEHSESILEACRAAGRVGMKKIAPFFSPFTNGHPWDAKLTERRLATPGFLEQCKLFDAELDAIGKKYPGLEIIPTWGDEITLRSDPLRAWEMMYDCFRSFSPDRRVYISSHPLHTGARKSMKNQPQVVNWSVGVADGNELRSAELMDAWGDKIKNLGYAENWCYNNKTPFNETSATRLAAGYWLWASPFDAHVPWTYYTFEGDPLNPLDGTGADLGFAYPVFDGEKWTMIPSIQWQSWRDGYDDLRWAATLEKAIEDAKDQSEDHLAKAKALWNDLRQYEGSVDDMAAKLSPNDFTSRRRAILEVILALTASP